MWLLAGIMMLMSHSHAAENVLTAAQLTEARQNLEVLSRQGSTWAEISLPSSGADGVDYREEIERADIGLDRAGFYLPADIQWMNTTGKAYMDLPETIQNAPLKDVRMLLGGISRLERFTPGLIGKAVMTGVYRQALGVLRSAGTH